MRLLTRKTNNYMNVSWSFKVKPSTITTLYITFDDEFNKQLHFKIIKSFKLKKNQESSSILRMDRNIWNFKIENSFRFLRKGFNCSTTANTPQPLLPRHMPSHRGTHVWNFWTEQLRNFELRKKKKPLPISQKRLSISTSLRAFALFIPQSRLKRFSYVYRPYRECWRSSACCRENCE